MKKKNLYILLLLIISIYACYTSPPAQERTTGVYRFNFSSIYNPAESAINPDCFLYHDSDTNTAVFFRHKLPELNALHGSFSDNHFRVGARYILREAESFSVTDSATLHFRIRQDHPYDDFYTFFNINTEIDKKYVLIVILFCRDTKAHKRFLFEVDKSNPNNAENYFIEKLDIRKSPKFDNFVKSNHTYKISWQRFEKDTVSVKFFNFTNTMPEPPYSNLPTHSLAMVPDSVFVYVKNDSLRFEENGIYLFQASSESNAGLLILNSGQHYPLIKTLDDMVAPLRYISGGREFNRLAASVNLKKDMDDFWFSKSNNSRVAAEQIRVYYNRVQLVNKLFSDYRQGFRTDRGMIYIMFGAPSVVRLDPAGEEWFYGENPDVSGLSFSFEKHKNHISTTEYRLIRGVQYQNIWGQAISTWRSGRIFLINK